MYEYIFNLIPFLIDVSIFNEEKNWSLGPEYVFSLSKITAIHTEPQKTENLMATVKCQPKISFRLICCIQDVSYLNSKYENNNMPDLSVDLIGTKQVFEITFHERGVKLLTIERNSHFGFDIVKWIVEQINIGIKLKVKFKESMEGYEIVKDGMHIEGSFKVKENIWKNSKCNTLYSIDYKSHNIKNQSNAEDLKESSKVPKNYDSQLIILPMYSLYKPHLQFMSQTFSIKRDRDTCIRRPRYVKLRKEVYRIQNVTSYFNIMNKEKYPFTSYTYLEGTVKPLNTTLNTTFIEKVNLKLLDVKPASEKFSINGKWILQNIDP